MPHGRLPSSTIFPLPLESIFTLRTKREKKRSTATIQAMPDEFDELIERLRAGDADAAEQLVRQYEPVIRVHVRSQMRDPRLRRAFDSLDVCQSVLGSFFVRASLGQYDLADPAEVVKLLVGMAKNKLAEQIRKERRQCRDNRRVEPLVNHHLEVPAVGPGPRQLVAGKEMLHAIRQSLSEDERQLADRRAKGQGWNEIAAELGGTAESLRKQLERAIARVVGRFGLDEEDHE
jgi:RNA polymerase sigma-70 factor (ECF subfamily)